MILHGGLPWLVKANVVFRVWIRDGLGMVTRIEVQTNIMLNINSGWRWQGAVTYPHDLTYVLFYNKVPSVPPTVRVIYKVILQQKKGTWGGRLT